MSTRTVCGLYTSNTLSDVMFGIRNLTKTKLPWLSWHSFHHWNIILSFSYTSVTSCINAAITSTSSKLLGRTLTSPYKPSDKPSLYLGNYSKNTFPFLRCITWVLKCNSNALREYDCLSCWAINCTDMNKCLIVRSSYIGYIKLNIIQHEG
jgi:hypothetical protein